MTDILEQLSEIFAAEGAHEYLGEDVTMGQHMLQAAVGAHEAGAKASLVAAALLHDIGYFSDVRMTLDEKDRAHDEAGARFLGRSFGPEITEPVRLHVTAKRYLCAVEDNYFGKLSTASVRTLELQGGPMNAAEVALFESNTYAQDAVQIRRYDDEGKVERKLLPEFESFLPLLSELLSDT